MRATIGGRQPQNRPHLSEVSLLAGKVGEFEDLGGNDPLDGGHGNPPLCPGEPHGQRSLAGSSP